MGWIDRYFGITSAGSTLRREIIGGMTTFATMSYIVFVQPTILSAAGMDFGSVLLATCLSAAFACLLMGLVARYPFALAPGMGENFLFAFTVCGAIEFGGMGFSWQGGLTIVLVSGVLFLFLSLFRTREKLLDILPDCLKNAIGPAIGMFIAFVGLQWGGVVVPDPATMVRMAWGGVYPSGPALITVFGVFLIAVLAAWHIRGGILIGILASCGVGIIAGVIPLTTEPVSLSFATFFHLDFAEPVLRWHDALLAIALFFFLDLFDTVGTLVGLGKQAGYIGDDGHLPRAGRAFFSDATASCVGALFGTSTVTTYIESASGVAAGARTGLAAVVTGACFVLAIGLAPIVRIVGNDIGPVFYNVPATSPHVAMYPAVAPALIFVGFLMMAPLRNVKWQDVTESLPAFLTIAMMVFGFGITEGVAVGCISFTAIKLLSGRGREVHPAMAVIALALLFRYVFLY